MQARARAAVVYRIGGGDVCAQILVKDIAGAEAKSAPPAAARPRTSLEAPAERADPLTVSLDRSGQKYSEKCRPETADILSGRESCTVQAARTAQGQDVSQRRRRRGPGQLWAGTFGVLPPRRHVTDGRSRLRSPRRRPTNSVRCSGTTGTTAAPRRCPYVRSLILPRRSDEALRRHFYWISRSSAPLPVNGLTLLIGEARDARR
jgi:hypothetical protein